MAEDQEKDSKTQDATEKKLRDAVEKGNIPFSRELPTFASLLAMLVVACFLMSDSVVRIKQSLSRLIDNPDGWSLESSADAISLFQVLGAEVGISLIPIFCVFAAAGLTASLLQNPPSIVFHRIKPDPSRISLGKGWTRIFGIQGQVEFLKATFKFLTIAGVSYLVFKSAQADVMGSMFIRPQALPRFILELSINAIAAVVVVTLVLASIDLVWSRFYWHRELRMSHQDIKDEMKQSDGDPILKSRMRSLARDRSRNRMLASVPQATLIIVNPTHFSVALRYVQEEGGAPLVVAKGQDLIALKIREIAKGNAIPIVEDRALARSLYNSVETDQMIPPEFYRAVAEVVFFVQQQDGTTHGGVLKR